MNRENDLIKANKELAFQNEEKEKRAAELVIANAELAYQNREKEKRAAELVIANTELAYQNEEKEKRAAELLAANEELAYQNEEKEKRAAELIIANKELIFQHEEKEKRAAELLIKNQELMIAYNKIKDAEEFLKEYIRGLKEMMFMTHHKLRQPVANIIGISNLLDEFIDTPQMLRKMIAYLKDSALSLDVFTQELTEYIGELEEKGKNKNINN